MPEEFDPDLLQQLCAEASKETNPDKLFALIKRINDLYDAKAAAKAKSRIPAPSEIEKLD